MNFFAALPIQVQLIAAFLLLLTLLFAGMFLVPGTLFRLKMRRVYAYPSLQLQDSVLRVRPVMAGWRLW
jgi:hypothetical protein